VASTLYRETLWLTSDHLGTPRMIAERTGTLSGIKRHDYLPFGEEVLAGIGGRTSAQGYVADSVRQQFTGYERDSETRLEYAQARYYASLQGRFTSIDPALESAKSEMPQSWNRYTYALNSPLRYIDPDGELWVETGNNEAPLRWVDQCSQGQTCYDVVVFTSPDNLRIYGSNNAQDITTYRANADGMINLRALSAHHDANFVVADGQNVPEEFVSSNTAGHLFTVTRNYGKEFPGDEKIVFTAGSASNGRPGNCNGAPCHRGHQGNEMDFRYMGENGRPLRGDDAATSADLRRTEFLIRNFRNTGFAESFTGDTDRLGSSPASARTERIHRNHLHIGVPAPARQANPERRRR